MKKYNLKFLCISLFMAGMFLSCAKDTGNYNYTKLDAVNIDVTNLPTAYSTQRFEGYLNINPTVTYKGEVVNPTNPQFKELSFKWEMYPLISGIANTNTEKYVLGNNINLHYLTGEIEDNWEILFTVTNNLTGVKAFAKFTNRITGALSEGWMVLYERDGNTDIGIITNNEISKTTTTEKLSLNVYQASNGSPVQGTPGMALFSKSGNASFSATLPLPLYIQTSKEIVCVSPSSFTKVSDMQGGIFYTSPSVIAPSFIGSLESRKDLIINNNKIHRVNYGVVGGGTFYFSDAFGGAYGTLAAWIPSSLHTSFDAIVYDQTNKKFLKVAANGASVEPIASIQNLTDPNNPMAAFDVNNVGLTFVMADMGWNSWENIVMKDNAGKYYLLRANFKEGETVVIPAIPAVGTTPAVPARTVPAAIGKQKYDMSNCPEIASINSVTAGNLGEIFYYSANNHMYQYRYLVGATDLLWTAPAGEIITNIQLQKYNTNTNRAAAALWDPKNFCKILYIATYNENTKIGTVYQMEVNPTSGAILGNEKKYSGFGKIKSMSWKLK